MIPTHCYDIRLFLSVITPLSFHRTRSRPPTPRFAFRHFRNAHNTSAMHYYAITTSRVADFSPDTIPLSTTNVKQPTSLPHEFHLTTLTRPILPPLIAFSFHFDEAVDNFAFLFSGFRRRDEGHFTFDIRFYITT
jgi:hypothetical protein